MLQASGKPDGKSRKSGAHGESKKVRYDGASCKKEPESATEKENSFCIVVDRDWHATNGFRLLELQSMGEADKDGSCEAIAR